MPKRKPIPRRRRKHRGTFARPTPGGRCGEVRIVAADGTEMVRPAYSPKELQRVVKERNVRPAQRDHVIRRDKGNCRYCGIHVGKTGEIDHVIPVTMGGSNRTSNLVLACKPCNRNKGTRRWTPNPL